MSQFCSCGAELPPDAFFCHKCGKPQKEVGAPAPDWPPTGEGSPDLSPPQVSSTSIPLALNFHNPVAVRAGLAAAATSALLSWLPFLNPGFVIWWVSAGFFSVYLYRRRTGQLLSVSSGLRMGWITGVLTFAIMTLLFTVTMIPIAVSKGGLGTLYQEQMRNMPIHDPNMEQALKLFESPAGLATILVFTLLLFFALITFLCTAGGALGAKIVGRD